ncbi:MAG TPA: hypothetical protein ENK18_06145 [Deltaproteobacteria bacterium]|nr:hypothetical protein [Deltaproteobacteria bacterium]
MVRYIAPISALLCLSSTATAGYEVSSFRRESRLGSNYWNAASALDTNMETCWRINAEQPNEGSWISIDTPPAEIDKLGMVIGWAKDEVTFKDHTRIKTAKVEIFDIGNGSPELKAEATVQFEDQMGWQIVELPDTKVGGEVFGGKVKITVLETYPGKDFPSLAVSEVRIHLKEFPAETLAFQDIPSSEAEGHGGDQMMDGSARSFWASTEPTATFSVKAPGYGLSSLGIQPGPASYGRPKTVKITANQASITHTMEDTPGKMQWLLLPALVGYTGGAWGTVQVEIVDTYPGDAGGIAIAEIKMNAGSIEEF